MEALSFNDEITKKLSKKGISVLTAVQKDLMPLIHKGKSCLFESETGTGKTIAYLLPLLQRLVFDTADKNEALRCPKLIVAAPTKELAAQIKKELNFFMPEKGKTLLCFGGCSLKRQIEELKAKPFALIGSPERLLELIRLKKIKTGQIEALVFDEADRLLSSETENESTALIKALPQHIQFCACSATLPAHIQRRLSALLADRQTIPEKETHIRILPKENVLTGRISHWALYSQERDKADTLRRFFAAEKPKKALIFCTETTQTEYIAQYLSLKKIDCAVVHARTDKIRRKQALDKFRNGSCAVLITSDLAARGLDIEGISHVIQMGLASNRDSFIHRAGRTGRSGKTGINLVIGTEAEMRALARLEKKLNIVVYPKVLHSRKVLAPNETEQV